MDRLIHTLTGNPAETTGRAPKVNVYRHRRVENAEPELLAVREMPRETGIRYFELLKECQKQGRAIIEVPIALLQHHSTDEVRIVTRWKGGKSLERLMKDSDIKPALKRKAAISLVRKVATLHAMGFKHNHLRLDNAVYSRPAKSRRAISASLVDFTRMRKVDENEGHLLEPEKENIIRDLAQTTYYILGHTHRLPRDERMRVERQIKAFEEELRRHYTSERERTAVKLEQRKKELEFRGSKTQPLPETPTPKGTLASLWERLTQWRY